jgi:hypothetical protein
VVIAHPAVLGQLHEKADDEGVQKASVQTNEDSEGVTIEVWTVTIDVWMTTVPATVSEIVCVDKMVGEGVPTWVWTVMIDVWMTNVPETVSVIVCVDKVVGEPEGGGAADVTGVEGVSVVILIMVVSTTVSVVEVKAGLPDA